MIPSTNFDRTYITNIQSNIEPQIYEKIEEIIFHCNHIDGSVALRKILPTLLENFHLFSEEKHRQFKENIMAHLLSFAEIVEQQKLAMMMANWYVNKLEKDIDSEETRLPYTLQAMHYFSKAIQIGNYANDPLIKEIHKQTSRLFFEMISSQHQLKVVQKDLNALTKNVASDDYWAFEIFERHMDRFHHLKHFCTESKDFELIKIFFGCAIKSINNVLTRPQLEKYSSSSEKIKRGLECVYQLPEQMLTQKYGEALSTYRLIYNSIDFSKKLAPKEIRSFQESAIKSFRDFFKILVDDALIILGPPPSIYQKMRHLPPCRFEILAMGSLGREEVCPYSDLEFIIIIENCEAFHYFKKLVQIFEIQIASLGETSTNNPVFTCIHKKNPSGFHIDSSPSLNAQLIQTPSELAKLQINPFKEFQTIEYTALRTNSLYTSDSTHSLFESYQIALKECLEYCREERAYEFLTWHYADYQANWKHPFNPKESQVNIKKQFVVPLYYLLGDLALYFGISETNTIDIICKLVEGGCLTKESGGLLQECVSALYTMRIRLHLHYKEQKEEASCTSSDLEFLTLTKNEIALLEKTYWLVLQPLYSSLGSILKKVETSNKPAINFKDFFKNIDFLHEVFENNFFHLSIPLIKQMALHFCQIGVPLETHRNYFFHLSEHPQEFLRERYFNTLEKNLKGEDKESILHTLMNIPNLSGLRLSFSRELKYLEAAFNKISDKLQEGKASVAMTCSASPLIPRYLKSLVVEKILDGLDIKKLYQDSAHKVCRFEYDGYDLHLKQKPTHPMMEYAIHNLTSRIAGKITPPSLLVRFNVLTTQGQKHYPVLISKTISGKNLSDEWRRVKPNASYTWNLLCAILTRPLDGRFSNYILDDELNLFCVDNDYSFVELMTDAYFPKNQFCSALFSILPLETTLDETVLNEFAKLNSYAIILSWIEDIILKEKEYKALFSKHEETERLFTEDKNNAFTPSILFQPGALTNLHVQFWSLQQAICLALEKKQVVTSGFLLQELIDLTNGSIGTLIHKAYDNHHNQLDAKERLKQATSRISETSLTSVQLHKAQRIDPTTKKIENGDYSPEKAKEEFLATVLNSESQYAKVKENQKEIVIHAQFKQLKNDPIREEKALQALSQIFKRLAKNVPITLIFSHSYTMTATSLASFLNENVVNLELSHCSNLKNDTISLIQKQCTQLKRLSIKGCAGITSISGTYWYPILSFGKLEELDVSDCHLLQSLKLDAPLLNILCMENTPNLKVFENKKIFLAAIKQEAHLLQYSAEILKKDQEFILDAVEQNGATILYADESLKKDREFTKTAIIQNGSVLHYIDASFSKNRFFVIEAIKQNPCAFKFADKIFKKDRDFIFAVIKQNGGVLEYVDANLKLDVDFVLTAVTLNASTFKFVITSLKMDRNFVLAAVALNGLALEFTDESFKNDKEVILVAVKQNEAALKFADESFKKDRDFVLAAVTLNAANFEFAHESLKTDKDFVLSVVKQNAAALSYADKSLKSEKGFYIAAVKQDGLALQFSGLSYDKEIVMAAVEQNGLALKYANQELKINKEVVLAAVRENGLALQYAYARFTLYASSSDYSFFTKSDNFSTKNKNINENLNKDKEVVFAAISQNGLALLYADASFKKNKKFVLAAVKQKGSALRHADKELRKDKDFVLAAMQENVGAFLGSDKCLREDREFILEAIELESLVLKYIDMKLLEDHEFMLAAIKRNAVAFESSHLELKNDDKFLFDAIEANIEVLKHIDHKLLTDRDFVLAATKRNSKVLEYVDKCFSKDQEIVLAASIHERS
ncbi:MAG: DUF4116 domain-containing protein [Candidatus Protochlamydia sp.]|nr:DUF4116 domain-containing protein [Candidatus Protochlamydia sp.]